MCILHLALKRNYISYRKACRGGPSRGRIGNMHKNLVTSVVWISRAIRADRQTDKQLIAIFRSSYPSGGEVITSPFYCATPCYISLYADVICQSVRLSVRPTVSVLAIQCSTETETTTNKTTPTMPTVAYRYQFLTSRSS